MKRVREVFRNFFIPHEGNDHRPHILRPQTVAFVLLIALAVESALFYGSSVLAPRSRLFGVVVVNSLVDETNQSRVTNDLPALHESPLLDAAAQDKANDMVANDYFAHTSPSGLTPWYWFEQVGYNFTSAGENLAVNFSDSQDVTDAWMNSPEHRANILNTGFTDIGMATAQGTYNGHPAIYVVELFGTPAPAAPPAESPIAFVNTAAAAASAPAPTSNAQVSKTASKAPASPKKSSTASGSATATLQTATSDQAFVAIAGATTQTSTSLVTTTAPLAAAMTSTAAGTFDSQANPVQQAAANPRAVVDEIYLAIIALFAVALAVNIFVKIRIQHAQVILGGMLVILVAGLLIVLNQHALAGTAIL